MNDEETEKVISAGPNGSIDNFFLKKDYYICRLSAEFGHIDILKFLLNLIPDEEQSKMINNIFRYGAECDSINAINSLLKIIPKEDRLKVIHHSDYFPFFLATENGNLDVMNLLLNLTPDKQKLKMIHDNGNYAFLTAIEKNKINALKFLCMSDPFYKWPTRYLDDENTRNIVGLYQNIDFMKLRNIALVSKNILNNEEIKFKNSKTENLDNKKKIKLTNKNISEKIFTPDNEIILKIIEFLSGGAIKQIKAAISAFRKAYGINTEFMKEYEKLLAEKEVEITGEVDFDLN